VLLNLKTRNHLKTQITRALNRAKVVALLEPRQCGKTTLAREFIDETSANYRKLALPVFRAISLPKMCQIVTFAAIETLLTPARCSFVCLAIR
jgi:hypothetical protein